MLILIPTGPRGDQVVTGARPVGPGYPRPYRPEDFRAWAAELDSIHDSLAADPSGGLTRRLLDEDPALRHTYQRLFGDPSDGIKGDLVHEGGDFRVDLSNGRHRAHYQMERGSGYTPVWVRSSDPAALDAFRRSCAASMRQADPRLAEAYERGADRLAAPRTEHVREPADRLERRPTTDRWETGR